MRKPKELRIGMAIGTDAHASSGLPDALRVMVARRGWLEKDDVINTREADAVPFKP